MCILIVSLKGTTNQYLRVTFFPSIFFHRIAVRSRFAVRFTAPTPGTSVEAGKNLTFSVLVQPWWTSDDQGRWSSMGLDAPSDDAPGFPDLSILLMFAPPKSIWYERMYACCFAVFALKGLFPSPPPQKKKPQMTRFK